MEDRVLYNVLKAISQNKTGQEQAPSYEYLKSLETIGLIKMEWDTLITPLGASVLKMLKDKFEKW